MSDPFPVTFPFVDVAGRSPSEPTVSDTLENSVCLKRPPFTGWMLIHGTSKHRPIKEQRSCAGLGALVGQCGAWSRDPGERDPSLGLWSYTPVSALSLCERLLPTPNEFVSSESDGTIRSERYCSARGEILRSLQDPLQRRRSARMCSSIKDESLGSEDDQTPS